MVTLAGHLTQREALLSKIQQDKSRVALTPEEVRRIDRQLATHWGIDFHPDDRSLVDLLDSLDDQVAADRFWNAHKAAAQELARRASNTGGRADAAVYDAIAHPEILGPVTSQRRHFILDAIAAGIGLIRNLYLTGDILDAGCHAGFIASIMAETLSRDVVGIDPSLPAIELARQHSAHSARVESIEASIPWETSRRFELIIAIDSAPNTEATAGAYLRGLANLLDTGGVAVIATPLWSEAGTTSRKQMQKAGLGFGYGDVIGGLGGIPPEFGATPLLVLMKGSTTKLPLGNLQALMESEWHLFRDYANEPGTPMREKTQAFERAKRRSKSS
jgi:SAM-dependent methyltransferase